jgi:outer membrane lipoprotein SlyB
MAEPEHTVVVGVFTDRTSADHVMDELRLAGFHDDQIGFVVRESQPTQPLPATDEATKTETGPTTAAGAVTGGVVGGLAGAAAAFLIPGFGPAIAGGILTATLGGAAIGAAAGSLIGTFVKMGMPEEEAHYYTQELQAGRTIVIVQANGRHYEAFRILRRNQAFNASTPPEGNKQDQGVSGDTEELQAPKESEQDQRTSGETGEPQARGNG